MYYKNSGFYRNYHKFKMFPFHSALQQDSSDFYFLTDYLYKKIQIIRHFTDMQTPFILVIGKDGLGKTALSYYLYHTLKNFSDYISIRINLAPVNPSPDWFHQLLANIISPKHTFLSWENLINKLASLKEKGKKIVLIFDNSILAQHKNILESLLAWANIFIKEQHLFSSIFMSSPENIKKTSESQKILKYLSARIVLKPLTSQETSKYITFQLARVDQERPLFTPDALTLIHQATRGVPLRINLLAHTAMYISSQRGLVNIDKKIIRDAVQIMSQTDSDKNIVSTLLNKSNSTVDLNNNDLSTEVFNKNKIKQLITEISAGKKPIDNLEGIITKYIFLNLYTGNTEIAKMLARSQIWLSRGNTESSLKVLNGISILFRQ